MGEKEMLALRLESCSAWEKRRSGRSFFTRAISFLFSSFSLLSPPFLSRSIFLFRTKHLHSAHPRGALAIYFH